MEQKWYTKTWFTVLMLILFFPVGIGLMWYYKKFNKPARIIITVFFAIAIIGNLLSDGDTGTVDNQTDVAQTTVAETKQETTKVEETTQTTTVVTQTEATTKAEPTVPKEYKSALISAKAYSDGMHMSKKGIYDQLTSEYGDQFSSEAAQYAVDHLDANWKENALKTAESYQENMAMSPAAIREQLTSEYGEQFTPEEADYAIANLSK